ncbi:MAG: flagellar hook-length control protein FliK [Paracoccaceae bacterium]|nr:flagellar hook-length control protein FliK [Paracoccaceae bacterium]
MDPALRKGADVDEKRSAAQTASTAPAEISATDTVLRPSILVPHETKFAVVGGADVRAVRGLQALVPELSLIAPGPVQKTVSPDSAGPPAVAARVREDVLFVQHAPPVISAAEAVPFGVSLRYLPAEYINARKAPDFAEGAQPVGATTQIRMTGAPAAPVSGAARPGGGPTMPDTDEASPAAPARQISEASGTPLLSGTLQPAAVPQNPAPQVQGDAGRATRLEQRDGALRDGTPEGALVAHRRPDVAVRPDVPDILSDHQERGTDIDATDDGMPGTREAPVAVSSALPAMRGGAGPLGVSAHAITQQVAHAAAQSPGAPVELTLAPEELGRVRLTLHSTDAGITVSIHAERPETLDMMRRNIDLLARDFRDQGYQMIAFNFGTESQRQDNPPMAEPDTAPARGSDPVDVVPAAVERPISSLGPSLGGLDLRM